jgi:hypothetical protein
LVIRATRPSKPSKIIAINIAIAACSKCPFIEDTTAKKPENRPAVVNKLGNKYIPLVGELVLLLLSDIKKINKIQMIKVGN